MTKTSDQDDPITGTSPAAKKAARTGRSHRFDPRRAILLSLGALIIVLALAVVLSFFVEDSTSAKKTTATNASDVGTILLGADDSSFTATTLPPTGIKTMDGTVTDLRAVAGGRPTMINMFSSSCTACRTEMPALERLHKSVGDKIQLVGLNLGDSQETTEAFVRQTKVTYRIVRDPTLLTVGPLNITAQPMTLWVDAKGRITGHRYGALTDTEMRLAVKNYLGIQVPKA